MADMRRQFDLPETDVDFLNSLGLPWEALKESNSMWLIIHGYSVPDGYKCQNVFIALQLQGYPTSQIDMASFSPPLVRKDEKAINAASPITIDSKVFQQWSRHRTPKNPWTPGEDNIETHLHMFNHLILNELTR